MAATRSPVPELDLPERRLAVILDWLSARFGPAVVRRLREAADRDPADRVLSSGALALDRAIGTGGLPRGHLSELVGGPSSGKTALLYTALASIQRAGGLVALVDAEGTATAEALLASGVDLDTLLLARPASATDALLLLTILARCRAFDLLGFASVPALRDLPTGRLRAVRGAAGEKTASLAAPDLGRLLARGLRVLTAGLTENPTAVLLTNEPLAPGDVLGGAPAPRSTGGRALAHFAALRIQVEPLTSLPDPAGGPPGLRVGLTVLKHKLGVAGGRAMVDLQAGRGFDPAAELLALGLAAGVVTRDWRGYRLADQPLGHRPAAAAAALLADPALAARVRTAVLAGDEAAPGTPAA